MPTWSERLKEFEPHFPMHARRREATTEDFERIEAAVGGKLPADYRSFVQECGGVGLEGAHVVLEDGGARQKIDAFFGFGEAKYRYDLHGKLERFGDRLPGGTLPIATDAADNTYALVVTGADAGAVLFWDHNGPREVTRAPDWLRTRIDAELARRGRPGIAADFEARWQELGDALPWWACLWRAASSFDAFIASLQR